MKMQAITKQATLIGAAIKARQGGMNRKDATDVIRSVVKSLNVPVTNREVHEAVDCAYTRPHFEAESFWSGGEYRGPGRVYDPATVPPEPCKHMTGKWIMRSMHIFRCDECHEVQCTLTLPPTPRNIVRKEGE